VVIKKVEPGKASPPTKKPVREKLNR